MLTLYVVSIAASLRSSNVSPNTIPALFISMSTLPTWKQNALHLCLDVYDLLGKSSDKRLGNNAFLFIVRKVSFLSLEESSFKLTRKKNTRLFRFLVLRTLFLIILWFLDNRKYLYLVNSENDRQLSPWPWLDELKELKFYPSKEVPSSKESWTQDFSYWYEYQLLSKRGP